MVLYIFKKNNFGWVSESEGWTLLSWLVSGQGGTLTHVSLLNLAPFFRSHFSFVA